MHESWGEDEGSDGDAEVPVVVVGGGVVAVCADRAEGEREDSLQFAKKLGIAQPFSIPCSSLCADKRLGTAYTVSPSVGVEFRRECGSIRHSVSYLAQGQEAVE